MENLFIKNENIQLENLFEYNAYDIKNSDLVYYKSVYYMPYEFKVFIANNTNTFKAQACTILKNVIINNENIYAPIISIPYLKKI